jgi:hypothetical protein
MWVTVTDLGDEKGKCEERNKVKPGQVEGLERQEGLGDTADLAGLGEGGQVVGGEKGGEAVPVLDYGVVGSWSAGSF